MRSDSGRDLLQPGVATKIDLPQQAA